MSFTILGTGSAHPKYVLTNDKLSEFLDTSDEWITTRTGIKTRYISTDETLCDLATSASRHALDAAGVGAGELDLILVSTLQGDCLTPSLSCRLQRELGAQCPAFDINAACSGFLYALQMAAAFLDSGRAETVLVCAAEMMSKQVDWTDRATCVLFGDGAGSVVLKKGSGLRAMRLTARGDDRDLLVIGSHSGNNPFAQVQYPAPWLSMAGGEVFRFAVTSMVHDIRTVLEQSGLTAKEIKYVVPHQANLRILKAAAERLKLDEGQVVTGLERYGNTSSASIPLVLDELARDGRLSRGDILVFSAFGGGLTTGACVIEY